MTKLRPLDPFVKHTSPLFEHLPVERRDDSPISVIAHSAVVSHPSSASTSVEHQMYREGAKLHLCKENGYATSEDDGPKYSRLALSHEFLRAGALESLPETQSFPLKTLNHKMGWQFVDEPHPNVELPSFSSNDLDFDTDSVGSGSDHDYDPSAQNFTIYCKEDDESSIDLFSPADIAGKTFVITPGLWRNRQRLVYEEDISAKSKYKELAGDRAKESMAVISALSAPTGSQKKDWERRLNSREGLVYQSEDDPCKENRPGESVCCLSKSLPSPGINPMSGSFAGVQNLAGNEINHGGLNSWRASSGESVRSLRANHVCGRGSVSKALPSKWHDAEKWLMKVDSPSQKKTLSGPQLYEIPASSRSTNVALPASVKREGKPAATSSFSGDEMAKQNLAYGRSHGATASDSELVKGRECRGLFRSGSEKYHQQRIQGERFSRPVDVGRVEAMHKLRPSSGGQLGNGRSEAQTMVLNSRMSRLAEEPTHNSSNAAKGTRSAGVAVDVQAAESNVRTELKLASLDESAGNREPSSKFTDATKAARGSLRSCSAAAGAVDAQALDCKLRRALRSSDKEDKRSCVVQTGTHTEIPAQDKYADMVVEKLRQQGGCPSPTLKTMGRPEFVVQTPRHGRFASMRDASTEISPAVSRRDMATQITPLPSSRSSTCCTIPLKNTSPARHNTPARPSASPAGTAPSLNLLELHSCHLAKLHLRDLPAGSQKQSFDLGLSNWSTREEEEEESFKCLRPPDAPDLKFNILEARASAWEDAERAKYNVKHMREEAKIEAWENLQRAKAEAELKKLEVKLEKLRCAATEKVMSKLAVARRRAQEMREAAEAQQAEHLARLTERANSMRKNGHYPGGSFGVCFAGI